MIDARGRALSFGGRVMKNVAGYDVSRVLAGSMGILGVIAEVSLKVLPRPLAETTLRFELPEADAIARFNAWAARPLPISATAWEAGIAHVRLSGAPAAIAAALRAMGGQGLDDASALAVWEGLREQSTGFFAPALAGRATLWRLSLPSTAPPQEPPIDGAATLIEWGGALRWLRIDADAPADAALAQRIHAAAQAAGGSASIFRLAPAHAAAWGALRQPPLAPALLAIHARLKRELDPAGILNPNRLVPGL
jgi:glycolate oxidase FAD binding subunit